MAKEYINSLNESSKPFIKEMSRSQQFASFIEKSYMALKSKNEVSYFVKGTIKLYKEGKEKLSNDLKGILFKLLHNYKNVCSNNL